MNVPSITPNITFKQFTPYIATTSKAVSVESQGFNNEPCELVEAFCASFKLPDEKVNHSVFDENLAQRIASYKEQAVKPVVDMLAKVENKNEQDETRATAGLFLLNRIFDAGAKELYKTYPVISKFNYSPSDNVQVMLAGIYRKTKVPDAFGPLVTMFLKNAQNPKTKPFDPNEEIGGAILEYLNPKNAVESYTTFLNK